MDLRGKTALVTGGTDGIGAQLIRQLRDKGATVIATGRNPQRIAATRADGFEVIEADLSSVSGVDAVLAAVQGRAIDILVNNAGAGGGPHDFRTGEAVDPAQDEKAIFLNLSAPMRLIAGLVPALKARPDAMIVNVTSGLAIAPSASMPVYCATKAGLRSYTQAVRAQLAKTSVRVVEALPPVVETSMTAGMSGNKLSAPECARQIIAAMEAGKAEANVGMTKILQVINSISPALARQMMIRF
ncbi:MAG: SDR family NAD(P)-dependent oxidoreductase [Sphingomonadales bacterium]|nr:SDR family NAD(P)-dependent oxidoreductase [Sphingomonadales bacterium]